MGTSTQKKTRIGTRMVSAGNVENATPSGNARYIIDRECTEREFTEQVRQFARLRGWDYSHTWISQHSPAGFPDCVFARAEPRPRLIFAELKRVGKEPSPAQRKWLAILGAVAALAGRLCGAAGMPPFIEVYVWTNQSWAEIERVLEPGTSGHDKA